jgi:hypothetical protein
MARTAQSSGNTYHHLFYRQEEGVGEEANPERKAVCSGRAVVPGGLMETG